MHQELFSKYVHREPTVWRVRPTEVHQELLSMYVHRASYGVASSRSRDVSRAIQHVLCAQGTYGMVLRPAVFQGLNA